ncbi:MAG: UDP-glucose 4-epimerase [Rhodospirillaceae bacterium]|jgi:UDP-glucose 4-epimerase|nr:UDP-glucose 4-epimerase [Rhodospirillaceae bacterium]
MRRRFLVTGGAGYVGSHLVAALLDRGDECVVLDNLCTGHRAAVLPGARLIEADLADRPTVDAILADGPWDAVFHFAALSIVGDSMREPFVYFAENAGKGIGLIESCVKHGVSRFVLSSTASLFGTPERVPIDETAAIDPGSPYGETKWMLERMLVWAERVHGLRSASLRYFNAAGADPAGRLGEDHHPETHLLPIVIDAALGRRSEISVFGRDYDTADGTCIRDYVHVSDLADAHLGVLDRLESGSASYNLGTGRGHSVLEVIGAAERVTGRRVPFRFVERRPGDPTALIASSERIRRETGWQPRFADLDKIIATALGWREAHPDGYGDTSSSPTRPALIKSAGER